MIDASFSVITCSFITIPRVCRDIRKNVASISIDAKRLKTTPHDQSLTTPDSRGCDVESQNTESTNTTFQGELSWNLHGYDAESQDTTNTDSTPKNQLSWDIVLAELENPQAGYRIRIGR
jgi:hypothetical protein